MTRLGSGLLLVLVLILALASPASAQVAASLVAADKSVQPGGDVVVALRMQHQPHWHSFWENPGTGLPTRLQWQLPDGWQVGEIQWPTPVLVKDKQGQISGHGYEGLLYLPVQLTASPEARPGQQVTLRATARWLMCETVCIPGSQEVELTLPVSAAPPRPNEEVRAALARQSMPRPAVDWKITASTDDRVVSLYVKAPHGTSGSLRFFPADTFVDYRQPQTLASHADTALLKMAVDAEQAKPDPLRLRGVLSWNDASGTYHGVTVDVPLSKTSGAATPGASVDSTSPSLGAGLLLFALLGGLVLNLMPCVFPVLGFKIVGFIDQAGNDRRKVTLHALTFTAGVVTSFWCLAALLAMLRAGGQALGWGFQLQSAPFVFVLAVVMLAFAMNLGGVFEVGTRATAIGSGLHGRSGLAGSFFSGALATLVATPCSAPFLAPALGAALALPTAQSFVVFTVIALGLSSPYLLLSAFPRLVGLLPRPGAWMVTFKQGMALLLYATVAYLVWVAAGQLSETGLLRALGALILVAVALWIYGRIGQAGRATRFRFVAQGGAAAIFMLALVTGWPRPAPPDAVAWEPWSTERVNQLQKEGRGIYVDFTARWCATCQVNKRVVFGSSAVRAYLRDHDIATLKADWTNSDPAITAELAKWNRSAVPFNLVYPPGRPASEPVALPELLTPDIVLDAFTGDRGGTGR